MRRALYPVVAAAMVAADVGYLLLADVPDRGLQLLAAVIGIGGVALLGRSTALPVAGVAAMFVGLEAAGREPVGVLPLFALWIVAFTAGSRRHLRTYAGFVAAMVVGISLWHSPEDLVWVGGVFLAPPFVIGWMAGRRRDQVVELEAAHRALAAEHERAERLAAEAERARIARDSHAVLSAAVSGMVAEARRAEPLVDADPAEARASFARLHGTGAEAMTELRRLLGLLHA